MICHCFVFVNNLSFNIFFFCKRNKFVFNECFHWMYLYTRIWLQSGIVLCMKMHVIGPLYSFHNPASWPRIWTSRNQWFLYNLRANIQPYLARLGRGEIESTWCISHYWAHCTSHDGGWDSVGHSVELLAYVRKLLAEILLQSRSDRHKTVVTWPGLEHGAPRQEDRDKRPENWQDI